MNVAIVHYHLKPGGVSTVIRRQLDACARRGVRACLILGEEPKESPGVPYSVVPQLGYDVAGRKEEPEETSARGKALAALLSAAARALFGGPPDLLHVHNPTIRKNAALCPALSELAAGGERILIQAHDFAEDWRPGVLLQGLVYPEGCRWAVLNGRDLRALSSAGLPDSAVELLPNSLPASLPGEAASGGEAGPRSKANLVLYPVRGIRRKNLGELLLLSRWLPPGLSCAVTLPPNNPRDFPVYEAWKALALELKLPVAFEAGTVEPLDALYARTRTVATTSVKEGFGFSFLEPLARGVPVAGRRLASVLPDFEKEGLGYPNLYSAVRVPRGHFDQAAFGQRLDAALASAASAVSEALGRTPEWMGSRMEEVRTAALPDAGADFGVLDEMAQAQVLERLGHDPDAVSAMDALNPFLKFWWDAPAPSKSEAGSLVSYSPERGAERLLGAYERTLANPGVRAPDRASLAKALLTAEGFFCPGL